MDAGYGQLYGVHYTRLIIENKYKVEGEEDAEDGEEEEDDDEDDQDEEVEEAVVVEIEEGKCSLLLRD